MDNTKRAGIFIILLGWIYRNEIKSANVNILIRFLCNRYHIAYNESDTMNTFFSNLFELDNKDLKLILFSNMCNIYIQNSNNWQRKSNDWIVKELIRRTTKTKI